MSRQGQDKVKERFRQGKSKVNERSRKGQGKINVRLKQSNHNHNQNLIGFDTIEINLVLNLVMISITCGLCLGWLPRVMVRYYSVII